MIATERNESSEAKPAVEPTFAAQSRALLGQLKARAEAETERRGLPPETKFEVLWELFGTEPAA